MSNGWKFAMVIMFVAIGYDFWSAESRLDAIEKDLTLVKSVTGFTVCVKDMGCEFYPSLTGHGLITDEDGDFNSGIYETEKGE